MARSEFISPGVSLGTEFEKGLNNLKHKFRSFDLKKFFIVIPEAAEQLGLFRLQLCENFFLGVSLGTKI